MFEVWSAVKAGCQPASGKHSFKALRPLEMEQAMSASLADARQNKQLSNAGGH